MADTDRLFQGASSSQIASSSAPVAPESTIDEPLWKTIQRDFVAIGRNVRAVLIPLDWKLTKRDSTLTNWDLWGPLLFILLLSATLSWNEKKASSVFSLVFTEVAVGSIVLTANTILLGGDIIFFQALCLLGYCLFPICIAAIVCASTSMMLVRIPVLVFCLAWASWATVPFMMHSVPPRRAALAVYPVCLLYVSLGWLALTKK